jgi:peptide chain release factor 2
VIESRVVAERHLKLRLRAGSGEAVEAIAFRYLDDAAAAPIRPQDAIELVYRTTVDDYAAPAGCSSCRSGSGRSIWLAEAPRAPELLESAVRLQYSGRLAQAFSTPGHPWKSTRFVVRSKTSRSAPMHSGGTFDYAGKAERLTEVLRELEDPAVWSKPDRAQELGRERTKLEGVVGTLDRMSSSLAEANELLDMAEAEGDDDMARSVETDLRGVEHQIKNLEFKRMFPGEMDAHNAFLDIQAGAGGTEAQDWANMLMRMYLRWGDKNGFTTEVVDANGGEVAGIKSATIKFEGEYAYGWLRTETGVHRLVRKSPFDSNARRHTSFASVFISPEIDDDINIDINPADLEMDVYRSSGAGGQHVNKTESAVRIRHLPSGIVVACQSERSQHKNRSTAMKMLKAKLYELEVNKRNAAAKVLEDSKSDVSWGNQIRSYVLDQSRIKDLRTGVEIGNTTSVLDGDLNPFLEESLKQGL